jgi:hypothetical protein
MSSPIAPARHLDPIVAAAVACVVAGWFWMNICVTSVGRLQLGFRFYDMWQLIERPALLLTGLGDGYSGKRIGFGALCLLVALAPLSVYFRPAGGRPSRFGPSMSTWMASLAPLALMVLCGALLYYRTSPDYFAADPRAGDLGREFIRFANQVAGKVVGGIARHVAPGAGAYVSLVASLVIAARGWQTRSAAIGEDRR